MTLRHHGSKDAPSLAASAVSLKLEIRDRILPSSASSTKILRPPLGDDCSLSGAQAAQALDVIAWHTNSSLTAFGSFALICVRMEWIRLKT